MTIPISREEAGKLEFDAELRHLNRSLRRSGSRIPKEAIELIFEIETTKSLDALLVSTSHTEVTNTDLETLDSKIARG